MCIMFTTKKQINKVRGTPGQMCQYNVSQLKQRLNKTKAFGVTMLRKKNL